MAEEASPEKTTAEESFLSQPVNAAYHFQTLKTNLS
jgi:hypothetical protein